MDDLCIWATAVSEQGLSFENICKKTHFASNNESFTNQIPKI